MIKAQSGPAGHICGLGFTAIGQAKETTMQYPAPSVAPPLANPLLAFATAMAEAQLKYWQAFQVEGAAFVAKRMHADLKHLRALGRCGTPQAAAECQWSWCGELRKDYAEEWARLAGTTLALGISELAPMGRAFMKTNPKSSNGLGHANTGFPSTTGPNLP